MIHAMYQSQFYLDETKIGKNRAISCYNSLIELNSYVLNRFQFTIGDTIGFGQNALISMIIKFIPRRLSWNEFY